MVAMTTKDARAATIVGTPKCTQQALNVLRYTCSVQTMASAEVWIDFCEDSSGSGCTFDRESLHSSSGTTHSFTLWNLKPSTNYDWQAYARDGSGHDTAGTYQFTTSSLADPDQDGTNEVDLSSISFTINTPGTYEVENVLFNYACRDPSAIYETDYLIIADASGNIVWYQDVRHIAGTSYSSISGFSMTRPERHILVIVDHEWIIEYDLAGTEQGLYCRCDASGKCPDGIAYPDVCFDDYVHHDVREKGDLVWALTAEDMQYHDPEDCNKNDDTGEYVDFVMDGLYAFSDTGIAEEWDISEVMTPYGCSTDSYWGSKLSGFNWSHANSIWLGPDQLWTLSLRDLNRVIQVYGDPLDADYRDIKWELSGDPSDTGDDWALTSDTGFDDDFNRQHHAWLTLDGTMFYDNHNQDGINSSTTRAIEIEFDNSAGVADIIAEYDLGLDCTHTGSAFDMLPSGNVVVTCGPATGSPASSVIQEFDTSGSTEVWEMKINCDSSGARNGPVYRGRPVFFVH